MKNSDFYDFGEQIQKIVQSAIDSNDFRKLNETVRQTVNDAVGVVRSGVSQASESIAKAQRDYGEHRGNSAGPKVHRGEVHNQSSYKQREKVQAQYFVSHPKGEISGTLMVMIGFILSTIFGIGLGVLVLVQFVLDGLTALLIPISILLVLFVLFLIIGMRGHHATSRVKRFKQYRKVLDDREFCDVDELADEVGKTSVYVVKDLKDMMKRRMFLQGHLDKQEKCFLITDHAYDQYCLAQQSLEEREARAKAEAEKMADPRYSEEVRTMLAEGKRYVEHIRACNDAIPGEDISAKISRLELIISRIFTQVAKDPTLAPELHQFMNYYLPTTQKLLDVYQELDSQPVQGQNISETKKEIEATLDTVNQAFENLLDSCYKDTAWDVSTDISVLNTMLAKEGLTGDEIKVSTGKGTKE